MYISTAFSDKKLYQEEGGTGRDDEGFYRGHIVFSPFDAPITHLNVLRQCPNISEEGDNVNFQKMLEHDT